MKCQKISKILNLDYTKVIRPEVKLPDNAGDMRIEIKEVDNILKQLNIS